MSINSDDRTIRKSVKDVDYILSLLGGKILEMKVRGRSLWLKKIYDHEEYTYLIEWTGDNEHENLDYELFMQCQKPEQLAQFYQLLLIECKKLAVKQGLIDEVL